jgi:hypothetical protein
VPRILTFISRLTSFCLQSFHHRFVDWTKPSTTALIVGTLTDLPRSKSQLMAENALLRKPLIILRRQVKRPACTRTDRMLLVLLARMARTGKQVLFIIQPETLLRWHRQGFKLYWKDKSRAASAKPKISAETVAFIKEMAVQNRLWGAERIRGEFLKLGIHVSKRTIQKYMRHARTPRRAGQNWATFLRNHAKDIWTCDALAGDRPLLSLAVCLLHDRYALSSSHPCGCPHISTSSYRRLDRPYRCGRRLLMDNRRTSSFVIVITSLDPVSRAWQQPAASRCSPRLPMHREPMRSVSGFS